MATVKIIGELEAIRNSTAKLSVLNQIGNFSSGNWMFVVSILYNFYNINLHKNVYGIKRTAEEVQLSVFGVTFESTGRCDLQWGKE